jgi:TRAP-type C4-dicarboxylate transport system permease small subunit
MRRFVRAMDAVYLGCIGLAGAALLAMTLIIPWGVFARYVLGTGSRWPEPLAVLLMIVFTFFGGAAVYRAGGHIAVAVLTQRLPASSRRAAALLSEAMIGAIALFMLVWGARLCGTVWAQSISEFPSLSVGVSYLPLPLSGMVTLFFVIERVLAGDQHDNPVVQHERA